MLSYANRWRFKNSLPSALLLSAVLFGSTGCAIIQWQYDPPTAKRMAADRNQPMRLYFCDWLSTERTRRDLEVFTSQEVAVELQKTINVFIQYNWFEDLANSYNISIIPTCVLTTPTGRELSRISSVPTTQEYLAWVRKGLAAQKPATAPRARPLALPDKPTR